MTTHFLKKLDHLRYATPQLLASITLISVTQFSAFFVTIDDDVYFIGKNYFNLNIDDNCIIPWIEDNIYFDYKLIKIPALCKKKVQYITTTWRTAAAITKFGELYMWGSNEYAQVGKQNPSTSPNLICKDVQAVALGMFHTIALTNQNTVKGWGMNEKRQAVGTGYYRHRLPADVKKLNAKIIQIAAGAEHSLALDDNGNVYGWGDNSSHQIDSSNEETLSPHHIKELKNIIKITSQMFAYHSAAIDTECNVYVWGKNDCSQIQHGFNLNTPVKIQIRAMDIAVDRTATFVKTQIGVHVWGHYNHKEYNEPSLLKVDSIEEAVIGINFLCMCINMIGRPVVEYKKVLTQNLKDCLNREIWTDVLIGCEVIQKPTDDLHTDNAQQQELEDYECILI